jgi:hypothetical protein
MSNMNDDTHYGHNYAQNEHRYTAFLISHVLEVLINFSDFCSGELKFTAC